MRIQDFFINGDMKGAIAYMREHEEFGDILPAYIAIFENCEYRTYDVPEFLGQILLQYQVYYRDVFYCGLPETAAADKLLAQLKALLDMPDTEEALLAERLQSVFEAKGYHALFGKTQGYYGPYVWKDTVPAVYSVELPEGTAQYTVNILGGFVFRSWMDYLTFGRFGTGGWASSDGTINCIEQAYDFESERFLISLLKHEAQHTLDMKQFPGITPAELEYRAKLVELHYSSDLRLLQKFLSEADESRTNDSHAVASARLRLEFADTDQSDLDDELELLEAYMELMCYRYPDLQCEYDIDPELGGMQVPNFILQPIVENSLLHGLKNKGYRGDVRISARKTPDNRMEILVIDTGSGFAEGKKAAIDQMLLTYAKQPAKLEGNSIGILNVQKRIKLLCGQEYGLSYTENPAGGVTAHLLLPMKEDVQ